MKIKPLLLSDYKKQADIIRKTLEKEHKKTDITNIHALRIACKRMKALLSVSNFAHYGKIPGLQEYKKIMNLFDVAGEIRNKQVQFALLKHYSSSMKTMFIAFQNYMYDAETLQKNAFLKYISSFKKQFLKKLEEKFALVLKIYNEKELFQHLEKEYELNQAIVKQYPESLKSPETFHDERIQLKRTLYITEFIEKYLPDSTGRSNNFDKQYQIAEWLGNWHDIKLLREKIVTFIENYKGSGMVADNYRKLTEQLDKDCQVIEKRLLSY